MILLHGGLTYGMVAGIVTLAILWFLCAIVLGLSVFRFATKNFIEGRRLLFWFTLLLIGSFPFAFLIAGIVESV